MTRVVCPNVKCGKDLKLRADGTLRVHYVRVPAGLFGEREQQVRCYMSGRPPA